MSDLVLILILSICVLFAFFRWQQQVIRSDEPPLYPGSWPLVGHTLSFVGRKKIWNNSRKVAVDVGFGEGACTLLIGPIKIYVVCNPNDSITIANQCLEKSIYYNFGKSWIGESLLTAESTVWKKDRRMLMPAFNHHVLGGFMETFNKVSRQVVEKMSTKVEKGSFDHSPFIKEYGIDTLCKSVLGIDISHKKEFIYMSECLMDIIVKRSLNVFLHNDVIYNWTNLKKTEEKYLKFLNDISDDVIRKKRSEAKGQTQNNIGTKKNFLDLLYDISTLEDMTDVKMRDQLNLMIAAGFDTISVALLISLVVIGHHENVQEKIYKEIVEVLSDISGDVKQKELDRLVYLDAVIKETIRLYPPVPIVAREIKDDIKLEKYTLHAGHSCLLLLSGMNLHPIWGDDVQLFKPERWLDPTTLPDHPAAFAAFSIGRRNCIGKYYAMMSMKTFLVHVIRNFIITADRTKMELASDVILRVLSGHNISLQRRVPAT